MKVLLLKPRIHSSAIFAGDFWLLAVYLLLAPTNYRRKLANTTIAFVSSRDWNWPAEKDRNFEIYVMNPDGKQIRRLTEQPKYDTEPAWSP